MVLFNKAKEADLKEYIYNSNLHDAIIMDSHYDRIKKELKLMIKSSISGKDIGVIFSGVDVLISISGTAYGERNVILSATIEEDFSPLGKCFPADREHNSDSIYMLFQMFSEDELHIVAKEICFVM
ncbi:MAG: hypothetical protein IJ747_08635 [Lachnospiraceae bacterium]|nr:hypothetical protein [Lachnospiraceae bacterium]